MDWLWEPFATGFMQRAWLGIALAGATAAWLGVHVTLRRMAFFGDALAHATLPGVVVAHVLGLHLLLGALASALVAVSGITWAAGSRQTSADSAIGITYTVCFALGVIGLTKAGSYQDLTHILVGNPMGVAATDLWIIGGCAVIVMAACWWAHRLLATTLIDREHAASVGLSDTLAQALLLVLTAFTVVTAITAVGLVLAVALLITPAAAARQVCHRLASTIAVAVVLALVSATVGLIAAYHLDVPAGATVVVVLTLGYVALRGWSLLPGGRSRSTLS